MSVQDIKQRFGIIGSSPILNHSIDTARQVAPTDITVFITGESGVGKEVFPQIIHHLSSRKHGPYIAVNCGAIPEGTIDSELFGHEKGSFTGAHESRKGYFEVANGGTIFLDEVAELPLSTQVRLLRVLETGEFMKVGSSKVLKTEVRVVAATNVNIPEAIANGKFREDLYYRLNTVPIKVPALRERKEDIPLLFRKFATDFSAKYRMPPIKLDDEAKEILSNYAWSGNIRQLKNVAEQISVIEENREINADKMRSYLPKDYESRLPVLFNSKEAGNDLSEREILYKVLFDMKKDITDLRKLVGDIIRQGGTNIELSEGNAQTIRSLYSDSDPIRTSTDQPTNVEFYHEDSHDVPLHSSELVEESLSLEEKEVELIRKALEKHRGKRKNAAKELGISERTLYRKIKEYNIK